MSDDLIKREDAIEAIHNYWKKRLDTLPTADIQQTDKILEHNKALCNFINAIPSADRPQGEWIEQEDCWQCSECGDEYVLEVGVKPIDAKMYYCPNCGCRMRKENE